VNIVTCIHIYIQSRIHLTTGSVVIRRTIYILITGSLSYVEPDFHDHRLKSAVWYFDWFYDSLNITDNNACKICHHVEIITFSIRNSYSAIHHQLPAGSKMRDKTPPSISAEATGLYGYWAVVFLLSALHQKREKLAGLLKIIQSRENIRPLPKASHNGFVSQSFKTLPIN
jgi:hypothetical protein